MSTVYLSGAYLSASEARIPVNDRAFTFGDGVYEVTPVYGGRAFRPDPRRDRLRRGLRALRIECDPSLLDDVSAELLRLNDLSAVPMAVVYFQVTRGAPALRTHHFPPQGTPPTVYAFARPFPRASPAEWEEGAAAVTVPDGRWARVDIKSLQLLPNVLAQQAAREAGAGDAVFVRDGIALEGAHNNLFVVFGNTVRTHPASNQILPGITRQVVLELARELGYEVEERPTPAEELGDASEIFLTGSTTEIRPVVRLDGRAVGNGTVGPVSRALYATFVDRIAQECGVELDAPPVP